MPEEEQRQPEQRKLKLGGGLSEKGEVKKEKEEREKETGSKMWVLLILGISVVISLIFSLQKGGLRPQKIETNVEMETPKSGGGLFGPAVYEYEK